MHHWYSLDTTINDNKQKLQVTNLVLHVPTKFTLIINIGVLLLIKKCTNYDKQGTKSGIIQHGAVYQSKVVLSTSYMHYFSSVLSL